MKELAKKVGTMEYDNLISSPKPFVYVDGGILIADANATVKRGTLLSKNADDKLVVYDGSAAPDCILCDDVDATPEGVAVTVYKRGCFNSGKVIGFDKLTDAHKNVLRTYDIVFKAMA